MRKWLNRLVLLAAGAIAGGGGTAVVTAPAEALVEEVPPYKILLVRDHGLAGRCGIELDKRGFEVVDPRKNEGPRWIRLQTQEALEQDRHTCDWKIPPILEPVILQAHGPTMEDVRINCASRFGDVNGDGDVDADDVAAVQDYNGQLVTDVNCRYDLNLDGRVNLIDGAMVR